MFCSHFFSKLILDASAILQRTFPGLASVRVTSHRIRQTL